MIYNLWYVPMSYVFTILCLHRHESADQRAWGRRRLYQISRRYKPISLFPPPFRSCWMLSVDERLTSSYATVLLTVSPFISPLLSAFVNPSILPSPRSDGCPRSRRLPPLPTSPRRAHAVVNAHGTRRDPDFQDLSLSA